MTSVREGSALSKESDRTLTTYARELASDLERDMHWVPRGEHGMGAYWSATDQGAVGEISARATAALEFFRTYAGSESQWLKRAESELDKTGGRNSVESQCRAVAPLLRGWADQVDNNIVKVMRSEQASAIQLVTTDLLDQVRQLNQDRNNSPVAAIVLSGASLEISLRRLCAAYGIALPTVTSISKLAQRLRTVGVITAQEVKEIESLGGVRNSAAHGRLEDLSFERAGLMEQQVNFLLVRFEERLQVEDSDGTSTQPTSR